MELDVSIDRTGNECAVSVSGEIDVYTSPILRERLIEAMDGGCDRIVVSLDGVGFIDSSGLGVLVGALRRVKEREGELILVCGREQILKVFRITGLDRVFPIVATPDEARGL
ncbi:MAG TPA: STAS domain-containing protein [Coriobacteriia bacterium]